MNGSANSRPPPGSAQSRRANFGGNLTGSSATPNSASATLSSPNKGKAAARPAAVRPTAASLPILTPAAKSTAPVLVQEEGVEPEDCLICAEPGLLWGLPECGHKTCHLCSVRMRALFKNLDCTFCKASCKDILFTSKPTEPFTIETEFSDAKLGLHFHKQEHKEASLDLLRFKCPFPSCTHTLLGWGDLKRHVKRLHQKTLCDLCCTGKKIFTFEHTLYPHANAAGKETSLKAHTDANHFECGFCHLWFFEEGELLKHSRESHEECFLCKKRGVMQQYFLNLAKVEEHFKSQHYPCPYPQCIEERFVVFDTELDLQAHCIERHGTALSDQRSRKDAKRIDVNFTIEGAASGSRGTRDYRDGEIRSRGPVFVGASGSGSGSGSGSVQPKGRSRAPSPERASTPAFPGENADTQTKHAQLRSRVAELVGVANARKTEGFRLNVRAYRASDITAEVFCERLYQILEDKPSEVGSIVKSLVELLEDKEKKEELTKTWRNFTPPEPVRSGFPSLAPVAAALPTPSPRTASAPPPVAFPALPTSSAPSSSSSAASRGRGRGGIATASPSTRPASTPATTNSRSTFNYNPNATPWSSSSSTPSVPAPAPRSVPAPPSPARAASIPASHEFPSLPVSQSELDRRARMNAAMGRPTSAASFGSAGSGGGAAVTGGWSVVGESSSGAGAQANAGGGGRGRRGKGRVLMTQGGVRRGG